MAKTARRILSKQGLEFMLSTKVTSARSTKTKTTLTIENDKGTTEIDADRVLVAVGRAPCSDGLGLSEAGVGQDEKVGFS